jgi:TetR/AcrR family transcriptional repressor of lmrAB and yxaGH operons
MALTQIIEQSGAPRGSVYFLFPGGKQQVTVEAINELTVQLVDQIRNTSDASPSAHAFVEALAKHFAEVLEGSAFAEGLPVTNVVLDSVPGSEALTAACRNAYDAWLASLSEGLRYHGIDSEQADNLAILTLICIEGAVVLCRAYQSTEPLWRILPQISAMLVDEPEE